MAVLLLEGARTLSQGTTLGEGAPRLSPLTRGWDIDLEQGHVLRGTNRIQGPGGLQGTNRIKGPGGLGVPEIGKRQSLCAVRQGVYLALRVVAARNEVRSLLLMLLDQPLGLLSRRGANLAFGELGEPAAKALAPRGPILTAQTAPKARAAVPHTSCQPGHAILQ